MDDSPLTFMQREIWFQCQVRSDAPLYHIGVAATLTGALDRALFERALQAVVDRQAVLRTAFHAPDGVPRQFVLPSVPVRLPYEDLSTEDLPHLEDLALRTRVTERFFSIASEPFDLGRPPLWRAVLLRVGEDEHWLFCLFHHLIVDGFHAGALLGELGAAYWRLARGDGQAAAPFPIEYRDFAAALDERHRTGALAAHAPYWLERLRALEPDARLPRDRLVPARRRFVTDGFWFELEAPLVEALARRGRACRATPYRLLVATFAIMIGRLTGARTILVSQPFSTQPPELQGVAGQFANALPVRIRIDPRQPFRAFAASVSRELDEARRRREFPIVDGFRQMQGEEGLTLAPIRFGASHVSHVDLQLPGFRVEQRPSVFSAAQRYDLWLGVKELASGISVTFGYAAELFERDTIARFATYFETLLACAMSDPERATGDLDMTPAADRRAVVETWNATARTYPDVCVHEAFERQARRAPEAPALVSPAGTLAYRELDARANQLAGWLRARGLGAGAIVPLALDRCAGLVTAMLAVLKAGGAYALLDPDTPAAILRARLEASGAATALTGRALAGAIREAGFTGHLLCLDDEWPAVAGYPATPPDAVAAPMGEACVVFGYEDTMPAGHEGTKASGHEGTKGTKASGHDGTKDTTLVGHDGTKGEARDSSAGGRRSARGGTGDAGGAARPLSVVLPHRALVRLAWGTDCVEIGPGDTMLQFSPCGGDGFSFEVWGALLNGARLVLGPRSRPVDLTALAGVLRAERVTVLHLPAEVFNEATDRIPDALEGLKTLVVTGDAVSTPRFRGAVERLARTRIVHAYGPAECTGLSTWQLVEGVPEGAPSIRIGRPAANSTAFVLDDELRPVPIKAQGELYVGGDGLALGYLHRADATASRFVPSPFGRGQRLLRTGRRARWHPDGTLELLDRREADAPAVCAGPEPAADPPETATEQELAAVWCEVLGASRVGMHANFFELGGDSIAWVRIAARLRARGLPIRERDLLQHRTVAALAACLDERAAVTAGTAPAVLESAAPQVDEDELELLLGAEGRP